MPQVFHIDVNTKANIDTDKYVKVKSLSLKSFLFFSFSIDLQEF